MTLDIARPEHREALRWACERALGIVNRPGGPLKMWAIGMISSPTESAALVRALCEAKGIKIVESGAWPADALDMVSVTVDDGQTYDDGEPAYAFFAKALDLIPALILALLACTTREEALAALREVGR